ncbi:MAG TPA: DMT family transporter [Methyloceanibacter sp.]|nr:DMT family transporter [Methyloceanibacter sp.]
MNSALLGLVAALSWGLHDFLARFPSRAVGPIPTVFAVTLAGLIVLSVWLLFEGGGISIVWPSLWLVAVTGIFFTLATLSLFAALAVGPISIVAPIAGSYPALAMLFAVAQGARPGLWQWVAIAAVMTGVAIVSRSGRHYEASGDLERGRLKGILGLAFLAGLCFAVALTAGQAAVPIFGEVETVWLARCFGLVTIGALYLWRPAKAPLPLRWFPVLGFMGLLDVIALGTIVAAGNLPDPAFATVVSSAFGAVTVLLARIFLKEPVTPAQFGGMALIFGGVGALASV